MGTRNPTKTVFGASCSLNESVHGGHHVNGFDGQYLLDLARASFKVTQSIQGIILISRKEMTHLAASLRVRERIFHVDEFNREYLLDLARALFKAGNSLCGDHPKIATIARPFYLRKAAPAKHRRGINHNEDEEPTQPCSSFGRILQSF